MDKMPDRNPEPEIVIDGRPIGPRHPPYIIAELSANHNGDIERAFAIMEAAKAAGADAVKLQTYRPDTLTLDHDGPGFTVKGGLWDGKTLYELYEEAQMPWDWHEALFKKAKELGISVFSSPFDHTAVDLLASLDAPAYKIASFEAIDLPLITKAAGNAKPLIISTGMAGLGEIGEAVETARLGGADGIALLHCVSAYPAPPEETNLHTIPHMAEAFGTVTGLSDHTMGVAVSIAAVALGACIIEKHVTLRRADGGADSAFSLEPEELKELVEGCRTAWAALGQVNYSRSEGEKANEAFRRSLYAVEDIEKGEELSEKNIRSIRPGYGLPPKHWSKVIGRRAAVKIARGTPLSWDIVSSD